MNLDASIRLRQLRSLSATMSLLSTPVSSIRDLGTYIDSDLPMRTHVRFQGGVGMLCNAPPDSEHPRVSHSTSTPVIGCSSDTDTTTAVLRWPVFLRDN